MHDLNESRRFDEGPPAEVPTAGLRSSRIPSPDGPVEPLPESLPAIWVFALTFDPRNFASETTITFLSDSARGVYEHTGALPDLDLEALRACLANEHQYWRATGPGGVLPRGSTWEEVEPAHAAFVRALLREIVTRVFHEESWWWDPNHQPSIDERQGRTSVDREREAASPGYMTSPGSIWLT